MPLDYPIHEHRLDNGLRVVVSPDSTVPNVTVNLWVGVGSRHESPGRTGFAHLFEHLMFQGSRNVRSGEHFEALMAVGGRLNATTWFDRTNYFETVPRGAMELALWLEADRHGHLLDAVNQTNLDNQRDVVKEEKRQRYDNQPYGDALIEVYAATFPVGHPYHHPTIGSMEDLDAATLDDVHQFFRAHYGPNNTVLTLVGDLTPQEGLAAAERYFGGLQPIALPPDPTPATLPPLAAPVEVDVRRAVPNDRLHIAFRLPVDGTPDFHATALAMDAIGGLASSRLGRRLVRAEQSALNVHATAWGFIGGNSLGFIAADISPESTIDHVESVVLEELERFAAEGPTQAELEASLAQTERGWLQALASQEERADLISQRALLSGDPTLVNTFLDDVRAVTAADIQRAAATWLSPGAQATVRYRKTDDGQEAA